MRDTRVPAFAELFSEPCQHWLGSWHSGEHYSHIPRVEASVQMLHLPTQSSMNTVLAIEQCIDPVIARADLPTPFILDPLFTSHHP